MSLFVPQFQIVSDLHLETPVTSPEYASFSLKTHCSNLLLLGDIGLVKDDGLFQFLRGLLSKDRGIRIFYVLGNHESYQLSFSQCLQRIRDFEKEAQLDFAGRFIFLHRNRYDVDKSITILGCTLWTAVSTEQSTEVAARLTDFNERRGIVDWTLDQHLEEHRKDTQWLNAEVESLQLNEPHRQIIVLTHHGPTKDARAIDNQHRGSSVSSGFVSDLSDQPCWTSPSVRLWAFGHTHYSCAFHDEQTGKLVVSNQKGY
ncbi:Metallo-dependent phosphatase-like protein, partial [Lophiotrema nucula]